MRVHRYWAMTTVERDVEEADVAVVHAVWAGSDESEDDARREAKRLAAELEPVPIPPRARRRRSRDEASEYLAYGAAGAPEPMIDEFLDAKGDRVGAITINLHGCDVLNTTSLAFVDVDLDRKDARGNAVPQLAFAPERPANGWVKRVMTRLFGAPPISTDELAEAYVAQFQAWIEADGARGGRAYRTAAGLRYLILNPAMDPVHEDTRKTLSELGSDPRYTNLCRVQASFRARLTPKPHRLADLGFRQTPITYLEHTRPSEEVVEFMRQYREASGNYAVCRLIAEFGNTTIADPVNQAMVDRHDTATGVGLDLPLA